MGFIIKFLIFIGSVFILALIGSALGDQSGAIIGAIIGVALGAYLAGKLDFEK